MAAPRAQKIELDWIDMPLWIGCIVINTQSFFFLLGWYSHKFKCIADKKSNFPVPPAFSSYFSHFSSFLQPLGAKKQTRDASQSFVKQRFSWFADWKQEQNIHKPVYRERKKESQADRFSF